MSFNSLSDYYRILQVAPDAEQEVIQSAYRSLAKKYHPDTYKGQDHHERMRELNLAYEVLGDREKRRAYDAKREKKLNVIRFGDLSRNASLAAIYGRAGELFEEQVRRDPRTDYTQKKAFDDAVWYLMEEAQRQDFINLRGKSKEKIASEMGDYISRSFGSRSQKHSS